MRKSVVKETAQEKQYYLSKMGHIKIYEKHAKRKDI